MKQKEYDKLKKKLEGLVQEGIDLYNEVKNTHLTATWVLDDCNSIVFDGIVNCWYEDIDGLYDMDNIILNIPSKFIREYFEQCIMDTYEYEKNIVDVLCKQIKPIEKRIEKFMKKFVKSIAFTDSAYDEYILRECIEEKMPVQEIVKDILQWVEIDREIFYSTDKKEWVESYDSESFIEEWGVEDGDTFYVKTDGNIEEYVADVEEYTEYTFNYRKK